MASSRTKSPRKVSQPSSPLATITERGGIVPTPPVPRKSSKRLSNPSLSPIPRPWSRGHSTSDSARTAPPAYDWVPDPAVGADDNNAPVEGEKLAELRRDRAFRRPRSRGGWGRIALIAGAFFLVIVALAVGLGVGISQRKSHKDSDQNTPSSGSGSGSSLPPQKFPLGQYSFVTALQSVETSCVSKAATWGCYPFTTFDPSDPSTGSTSMATFNWVINNTESSYATATTGQTESVPANLTVSSEGDIFGLSTFGPMSLTYVASSSNSSSPHYTFSFTMDKKIVPSPTVSTNGQNSVCFFNQTTFTGNIYLSAARNFPSGALANSTSIGGYEQWPYAVEVLQTAAGGNNVPNCYETVDGVVGAAITTNITAEAANLECLCDYRNYY